MILKNWGRAEGLVNPSSNRQGSGGAHVMHCLHIPQALILRTNTRTQKASRTAVSASLDERSPPPASQIQKPATCVLSGFPHVFFPHENRRRNTQKAVYPDSVILKNWGCAEGVENPSLGRRGSGGARQDSVSQYFAGIASSYKAADTESVAYRRLCKS